jgi:hypothetical protein
MKTIKMPRAKARKWLKALRSGHYKQATRHLADECGFCCLGVLEVVLEGEVEMHEWDTDDNGDPVPSDLPSREWLRKQGITFLNEGKESETPFLPLLNCTADAANDGREAYKEQPGIKPHTFTQIARALEKAIEYTD